MSTRFALVSLDDVLAHSRWAVPDAERLLISWDKRQQAAAAMGALDADGRPLDVPAAVLARLTGLLSRPVGPDAIRLGFPETDLHGSGMLLLDVAVDEPVWARVLTHMATRVAAGLRVRDDDLRDAVWVTLEAAGLPSSVVILERVHLFPEAPDDIVWAPVEAASHREAVAWRVVLEALPHPVVAHQLTVLLDELANRVQRARVAQGDASILMGTAVRV